MSTGAARPSTALGARATGTRGSAPARGAGARVARALVLATLLCGPLSVAEVWARGQLDFLYPYAIGRAYWPDVKLMLLERAGCPQVLALGSSVTNRTLVSELTRHEQLPLPSDEAPVERVFAFGLNSSRTVHLYAAWRHVRALGCTPAYVFVEVLPGTLNGRRSHPQLLVPFLDAATTWGMPAGFAREAGFDATAILESATWGRLLLGRLRVPVLAAVGIASGLQPASAPERPLPLDGMVRPLVDQSLKGKGFGKERDLRLRLAAEGEYRVLPSDVQRDALFTLLDEARAAGSRVVLHSPPVTSIYREIVDQTDGHGDLCRARAEALRRGDVDWHWSYRDAGFERRDFMDWNHLNRTGGGRYVKRLFRAVRAGRFGGGDWCATYVATSSDPAGGYPATGP